MASSFEQSTTKTPKKQKIRTVIRNASEQDWTGANVIPDKGELIYASDVNTLKIGDGITPYNNLPAISGGGSGGTTDYTNLTNKPQIDGVILVGNKTAADLGFADVATSGDYNDLNNKPTIPAAQVNADWNATSGVAEILNKPNLATVATSGNYDDLSNKPTIPTVNNPTITITQGGVTKGSFTLNQATDDTITLDAGGSGSQVQSDWNQTDTTAVDYIKNKPTALSDFTNDVGFITYAVTLKDWSVNNS